MKIHLINMPCPEKGTVARCTSDPAKVNCRFCQAHRPKLETKDGASA